MVALMVLLAALFTILSLLLLLQDANEIIPDKVIQTIAVILFIWVYFLKIIAKDIDSMK